MNSGPIVSAHPFKYADCMAFTKDNWNRLYKTYSGPAGDIPKRFETNKEKTNNLVSAMTN